MRRKSCTIVRVLPVIILLLVLSYVRGYSNAEDQCGSEANLHMTCSELAWEQQREIEYLTETARDNCTVLPGSPL